MALEGHVKDILSMDWSPNGYILASGSNDNTCRIWDIRKRACTYTLPAHTSLVSQVCPCCHHICCRFLTCPALKHTRVEPASNLHEINCRFGVRLQLPYKLPFPESTRTEAC